MPLPSLKDIVPHWWGTREVQNRPAADAVTVRHSDEPADPFQALHGDISRAFSDFWRAMDRAPFGGGLGWPGAELLPRTEVAETEGAVEVAFDLPGLEEKDLDISIASGLLTVKAERRNEKEDRTGSFKMSERSYGLIQRTVSLPPGVDTDAAAARYRNGVLTVTLPRTALPPPEVKRISVHKA